MKISQIIYKVIYRNHVKKYFSLRKIFLKFVVHNLYFYKLFSHYKTTTN